MNIASLPHCLPFLLLLKLTVPVVAAVQAGFWPWFSHSYAPVTSIDTSLYTHIFYAFLSVDSVGPGATVADDQLRLLANFSGTLKAKNASIKTVVSIGGSQGDPAKFSAMAADENLRKMFINSSIALAREYGFDGLDLAWEFPTTSQDMDNLATLLGGWKNSIQEEAQKVPPFLSELILTASVYYSDHVTMGGEGLDYRAEVMAQNVDWLNIMCFDYQGNDETAKDRTKAHAALFDATSQSSSNFGIASWIDAGLPTNKLVMGIPLYGRSWMLKNKLKNGIGDPAVAFGRKQKMSNQTGVMAYFEIEKFLKESNVVVVYDNTTVSAYAYAGDLWVSFDNLVQQMQLRLPGLNILFLLRGKWRTRNQHNLQFVFQEELHRQTRCPLLVEHV